MNILLSGVGGQGTVLASKVLAQAALNKNYQVKSAETIGMAQRGGSVAGHVRIGEGESPLIPAGKADLLLGFEPGEAVRSLPLLREQGKIVVADRALPPVSASLSVGYSGEPMLEYLQSNYSCRVLKAEPIIRAYGARFLNIALLAAAVPFIGIFSPQDIREAVAQCVAARFIEINIKVFDKVTEDLL